MKTDFIPGKKYKVIFQIEGLHRIPRYFVATYIGVHGLVNEELAFSQRPVAGTVSINPKYILEAQEVAASTKIVLPKTYRGGE